MTDVITFCERATVALIQLHDIDGDEGCFTEKSHPNMHVVIFQIYFISESILSIINIDLFINLTTIKDEKFTCIEPPRIVATWGDL